MKRIVCLANSRKLSGRCIAGKDVATGDWIRPVSQREHQEVSEYERQYEDGRDPQLLDIIDVPVIRHVASAHQPENWLLDPDYYWVRVDRFTRRSLVALDDAPATIWPHGSSTVDGVNDRLTVRQAAKTEGSLFLIALNELALEVLAPGAAFGNPKRKVKGDFDYGGIEYRLTVTDPVIEKAYLAKPNGRYSLGKCHVTVSLGEEHKGYLYKLIAAVILPN